MKAAHRRVLGAALVGYGVVGLLLIVFGAVAGMDLASRVERLTLAADQTIGAAARATKEAADAFDGADTGLERAGTSADAAAALARDASLTLGSLADAMSISIFGAQPLIGLADDFDASADQARELADALDGVSGALADSRADLEDVGGELHGLAGELDALRVSTASEETEPPPVRAFILLLLAWLALQSAAAVAAGAFILRRS